MPNAELRTEIRSGDVFDMRKTDRKEVALARQMVADSNSAGSNTAGSAFFRRRQNNFLYILEARHNISLEGVNALPVNITHATSLEPFTSHRTPSDRLTFCAQVRGKILPIQSSRKNMPK